MESAPNVVRPSYDAHCMALAMLALVNPQANESNTQPNSHE